MGVMNHLIFGLIEPDNSTVNSIRHESCTGLMVGEEERGISVGVAKT